MYSVRFCIVTIIQFFVVVALVLAMALSFAPESTNDKFIKECQAVEDLGFWTDRAGVFWFCKMAEVEE